MLLNGAAGPKGQQVSIDDMTRLQPLEADVRGDADERANSADRRLPK